jgi:hypothetical protein
MCLKLELFTAIALLSFGLPTEAHDIYSPLRDRLGNSCCHEGDCRPAPYRMTPTGVQMFVDGEWIAVPDYMIQYRALLGDTGETDGGHWCGRMQNGQGQRMDYATRCAVLPPNPTAIFEPAFALREGRIQPVP